MQWLLNQPDNILSQHEANKQFLRAEYTMLHPSIIGEARMANFINRYLTRNLDIFAKDIVDEIEQALEDTWGSESSKWHEISLYNVMLVIIGRIVNRVFVGLPLCRNPTYIQGSTKFAQMAPVTGGLISLLPNCLRPTLAPFITAYDTFQYWRMFRMVEPIVRERLRIVGSGINFKEQASSQPNDFIQWACVEAFTQDDQVERTPEMIAKRLAVLSFAAIQSSTLTITNVLLDIAASSDSIWIQSALRLEALKTVEKYKDNAWTRSSLTSMTMTDSVLRESLRLWSFVSHGVIKAVVTPNGLTLPSGEHLPYGAKCGIASYGPHHDSNAYDNPYIFRAFRFCPDDKEGPSIPRSFVTTSEYFMGFSHGRHAWYVQYFTATSCLNLTIIVVQGDSLPHNN
jgi:cytochrome P450